MWGQRKSFNGVSIWSRVSVVVSFKTRELKKTDNYIINLLTSNLHVTHGRRYGTWFRYSFLRGSKN